jgi:hypothetical protein
VSCSNSTVESWRKRNNICCHSDEDAHYIRIGQPDGSLSVSDIPNATKCVVNALVHMFNMAHVQAGQNGTERDDIEETREKPNDLEYD